MIVEIDGHQIEITPPEGVKCRQVIHGGFELAAMKYALFIKNASRWERMIHIVPFIPAPWEKFVFQPGAYLIVAWPHMDPNNQ